MACGPESATCNQIEVTRIFDGRAVVANRRAEDSRLLRAVFVRPNHHVSVGLLVSILLLHDLVAAHERMSRVENAHVVIQFFLDGGPISHSFCDWAHLLDEADRNRLLRSMTAGLDAQIFEPITVRRAERHRRIGIGYAIAMHRAMKIDS